MKIDVDNIKNEMNKEQVLPDSIRLAFDQSYKQIRQQPKKKRKKSWLKFVSAAVVMIAVSSAILLTNDTALAKLQAFLGLNDPGINTAIDNGDVQDLAQVQQSEDITITLEHVFADAHRLGLQLNIQSEQIKQDELYDLTFEYRLFDAQGKEIDALVSDTKPIAGPGIFSGAKFQLGNVSNNAATLELLTEANAGAISSLDGAKLVIETVHINKEGGITSVDGKWSFDLKSPTIITKIFAAENVVPGLELLEATLTNGSMHVSYKIDSSIKDENYIFKTALVNGDGEHFYVNSANVKYLDEEQTIISLVFPYSIWNESENLSLSVEGYEKLILIEKE